MTNNKRSSNGWKKPPRCPSCLQPRSELCSTCLEARNRHTIKRSLENWDMIPSMSQSSIVFIVGRLKRRRLGENVVSLSKLPTFLPLAASPAVEEEEDGKDCNNQSTQHSTPDHTSNNKNVAQDGKNVSKESTSDCTSNKNAEKNRGDNVKDTSHEQTASKEMTTVSTTSISKDANANKQTQSNKPKKQIKRERNLLGATIRIKKGKFTGIQANIIEIQNIRRVILDSIPGKVFDITEVILNTRTPDNYSHLIELYGDRKAVEQFSHAQQQMLHNGVHLEKVYSYEDIRKIYQGASVRVTKFVEHIGTVGKVVRAIVGDWYITDHPTIEKAFQESQFDVVRYAVDNDEGDDGKAEGDDAEVTVMESLDSAKVTGNSTKLAKSKVGDGSSVAADQSTAGKQDVKRTNNIEKKIRKDCETEPDLIGATIRIKKGKHAGQTGVITEKQTMNRLQLDTIRAPVDLPNVQVIRYKTGNNEQKNNTGDQEKHERYLGATVRVLRPEKFAGVEGKVIELVEADWYIVDNPDLPTAFSRKRFEVLRYAPDDDVKESVPLDTDANNIGEEAGVRNEVVEVVDLSRDEPHDGSKTESQQDVSPDTVDPTNTSHGSTSIVEHSDKDKPSTINPVPKGKVEVFCLECSVDNTSQNTQQPLNDKQPKEDIPDDPNTRSTGKKEEATKTDSNQQPSTDDITQNKTSACEETSLNTSANAVATPPSPNQPPSTDDNKQNEGSTQESLANEAKKEHAKNEVKDTTLPAPDRLPSTDTSNQSDESALNRAPVDEAKDKPPKNKDAECVVQLPSVESIELAARLSAFDSFLFLVDNKTSTVANPTATGSAELTTETQTEKACDHKETRKEQTTGVVACSVHDKALSKVLHQLIEHRQKARQLPVVKVLPGMDVSIEESDQPSRIIPMEQMIIRSVPGSTKERNDMASRLSAFDDFIFLVEDTRTSGNNQPLYQQILG